MTVRPALLTLLLVAALAAGSLLCAEETQPAARPNFILIVSDDQTYRDFGFMGNDQVRTPHLDRLAEQSACYPQGYVPTSVCRPSLMTLLTGLYPHEHGVYFNHPPPGFARLTRSAEMTKARYDELRNRAAAIIRNLPTVPRLLAEHGYRCLQTGKYWEGHWQNAGFTEGMTLGEPSGGTLGDKRLPGGELVAHGNGDRGLRIGRDTLQPIFDFLDDCKDQPFFIWYAPFLPHVPHDAPPEYFRRLDSKGIPEHYRPYYASIAQFDDTVGRVINAIEERQLASTTVFLFVVDNGWTPDRARFRAATHEWDHTQRSKRSPFEDGLRTPILVRWDGVVEPARHTELVSSIDLAPTILKAAGIDTGALDLPGIDLLASARGIDRLDPERTLFGEIYPGDATRLGAPESDIAYRWVRQGRFKLIVPHSHNGRTPWNDYLTSPSLFDVVADPEESRNLLDPSGGHAAAHFLRRQLDDWWNPLEKTTGNVR